MNIFFIHGIFDRGENFHVLHKRLAMDGHNCVAPTLTPNDGSASIKTLAGIAKEHIHTAFGEMPYIIVAFSMGCLIARHYLHEHSVIGKTKAFFAIAGPHRGTLSAYLHRSIAASEMRPGSDFLRNINKIEEYPFPTHTYYTPLDLMVFPPTTSRLPKAKNKLVWTIHHGLMTSQHHVCEDIAEKVSTLDGIERQKRLV